MTFNREALAEQEAYLRAKLEQEAGRQVSITDVALGVVALSKRHPLQAALLARMWWDFDVETLRALLLIRRSDTLLACWKDRPLTARFLSREFGRSHVSVGQTLQRGRRNLLAWLTRGT